MIDFVSFDVFMPDLEPELVRCPVPVIERRLREAIIEGCEDANIWTYEETIPTVVGQVDYDIVAEDNVEIYSLTGIALNGRELIRSSDFHINERGTLTLARAPKAVGSLVVNVTLKPTRDALVVGRVIYRDYYRMLIQGTLSKAYDMKHRLWSNPQEARKHRAIFEEEIADARRAVDRGFVTGSQRINYRFHASPLQRRLNPFGTSI